ncbi:exported hypothetical protein [Vibrio nigripulchritudo MADA3029]|uniref:hypothetical protein n=1 Tax=Vibrio nigripulchritudo TaxID=28173 RepID=UPI0003B1C584|nr:hypothetical protein [Vibrio nigripulchritudo]CCN49927.1 exported hypothetical protein [Vibrio nigripulchritudo MADA3020]CCN56431.1 exported hypothetical protein [Vibrio nigripulchritudo MADA3021]CCN62076.1 exported hypothetical protein [Vibrio nigripulchritudo MADA3029]
MKKYLLVLFGLLFTSSVFAVGNSHGGKIVHIASVNDAILFNIAGNSESNRPSCATTGRFSVHKDSVHASLVLTAFAADKTLANVRGLGTCHLWGNSEDLRWIEVCPLNGCP